MGAVDGPAIRQGDLGAEKNNEVETSVSNLRLDIGNLREFCQQARQAE